MSVEAMAWAFQQPIKPSSTKFVLVAMANHAGQDMRCWPSVATIAQLTNQDRKTVIENMSRLREMGYIEDTKERVGGTKQVPIYRLKSPENGTACGNSNHVDLGDSEHGNSTENGTVKQSQKRNSTENGTVPKFPINSTVFPHKQSRNSVETVPKTGHGTINEPSMNHQGTINKGSLNVTLPDWMPVDLWADWVAYRKQIRAALSTQAAKLCIAKLALLRDQGNDPRAVIEQSIMSGKWTGLFPVKQDHVGTPTAAGVQTLGRAGQATLANLESWLEDSNAGH